MNETITRRSLLRGALALTPLAATLTTGGLLRRAEAAGFRQAQDGKVVAAERFTLPPLLYPFNALEPHIDAMTMEIHHDRHHATYVKNLNDALAKEPSLGSKSLEEMLKDLDRVPASIRTAVRNNGGGHYNHTMFWGIMKPAAGGEPVGPIADAIKGTFGSFDTFRDAFNDAGTKRFGSGWVWLVRNRQGKLEIVSTPNQDNPLMKDQGRAYPILGNDVWEHAYYLKYQNKRADYLKAWWNVINWENVNLRLRDAEKYRG